jgi:hypothetical protein
LADDHGQVNFHNERGIPMFKHVMVVALLACAAFGGQRAGAADYVRGYTRSNGTYVAPYYRTHADYNFYNNWSTYPNINPYTGQMGTRHTPPYSPRYTFPSYGYGGYSTNYLWGR